MEIQYLDKPLGPDDLFDLYEKLDWNKYLKLTKEDLNLAMEQSWRVVYAYHNKALIGTGRVISDGIINAYLCGVGVIPELQNKGIGRQISKLLIESCTKKGLPIQLFCEDRLIPFYKKFGFTEFAIGMKKTGV
ncbi:hypothetical protein ADIS_3495 [Lunatimonas lonarensis]|uniref:N-acetyltransferase domain-containing protein n=1 Tax=Lunatimonas lonarensis TaxID=1232681 RepID=R7ZPK6_9BACT|nr:GNAT family N-acetyltransferase [Lunatimonas lonarensis]EON76017.1 hypothetical protein ADIS_3495 [Lunatimonas lonarensis]